MTNNFEEDIVESETSLQNLSEDDLSHLKQVFYSYYFYQRN